MLLLRLIDNSTNQPITNLQLQLPSVDQGCTNGLVNVTNNELSFERSSQYGTLTIKGLLPGCNRISVPAPFGTSYKSPSTFSENIEPGRPKTRKVLFIPADSSFSAGVDLTSNSPQFGQKFVLSVQLQPQGGASTVESNIGQMVGDVFAATTLIDGYIWVEIPGGDRYFLMPDFTNFDINKMPVVTSMAIQDFSGTVLERVIESGLPTGTYTFFAVGVVPGSDPLNPTNWLTNRAELAVTLTQ